MAKKAAPAAPAATSSIFNENGLVKSGTVLPSVLYFIDEGYRAMRGFSPNAILVQISGDGPLTTIPSAYTLIFRAPDGNRITLNGTENTQTGKITWGTPVDGPPILGVGGNLNVCTIDIYPAYKAIRRAGYTNPVYFCGLFQAVVPGIHEPWYCFTPNNCESTSSSNYIFVNAVTGEVRLFPTANQHPAAN